MTDTAPIEHRLRDLASQLLSGESRFYSLRSIAEHLREAAGEVESLRAITLESTKPRERAELPESTNPPARGP